ncbi:ribosomal protein S18-alanine N-acetyltransferase [Gardnerella swidsinskii]|jgi:ribosomal-protein-alanine acetyltransferase|uniref:ribosomal protein S18-alanine N-acetyltransferase n=1 Tax=Gardnerella TaxID=2701 RepID=UPI0001D85884|nr:acetyltransferase [Gardnerella vaginalis 5-1]MDK6294930.1 ribosomal protein S18-alanine N-acetyltransferase [Gardnerella swidsinskii]MDK7093781.1 ribosomal protein S18-alanine N-acetyltransferase [Gardnerella swidsinskii]RIY25916.1 ribosomal-protein-alanine N-acetyltransferase RimI [Bifidobacteriaceae bacterium WP021]RIY30147.1 ribosomal-protein-alanine N-acetyltransferase RimI [Bifidobacteriaceae bacterium NR016]
MIVDITRSQFPAVAENCNIVPKCDFTCDELAQKIAPIEADLFGKGSWNESMISQELQAPMRAYYAQIDENTHTLCGYAGYWFDGDDAQIMTIGVAKKYQRKGLAAELLSTMIKTAEKIGAKRMLLEVRVDNVPALALYERFGFKKMGLRKRYYQPEGVDAYTMCADLTAKNNGTEE